VTIRRLGGLVHSRGRGDGKGLGWLPARSATWPTHRPVRATFRAETRFGRCGREKHAFSAPKSLILVNARRSWCTGRGLGGDECDRRASRSSHTPGICPSIELGSSDRLWKSCFAVGVRRGSSTRADSRRSPQSGVPGPPGEPTTGWLSPDRSRYIARRRVEAPVCACAWAGGRCFERAEEGHGDPSAPRRSRESPRSKCSHESRGHAGPVQSFGAVDDSMPPIRYRQGVRITELVDYREQLRRRRRAASRTGPPPGNHHSAGAASKLRAHYSFYSAAHHAISGRDDVDLHTNKDREVWARVAVPTVQFVRAVFGDGAAKGFLLNNCRGVRGFWRSGA